MVSMNIREYRIRARRIAAAIRRLIKAKEEAQSNTNNPPTGTARLHHAMELMEREGKEGEIFNREWYDKNWHK